MRGKGCRAVVLAAIAAITLAGCASSSANSSAGSGSKTGNILIGVVGDDTGNLAAAFNSRDPQVDGINAAIDYINAAGGINGRKIQPVECDTQSNPARAPICAQQFISAKVLGVVGFSEAYSPTGLEQAEAAGILNFTYPNSVQEMSGPLSYPLMGGGFNSYPAQAKYWTGLQGKKNAAIIALDLPIAVQLAGVYQQALKRYGATKVTVIYTPETVADMTAYVTKAQQAGAQVIYGLESGQAMVLAIKAASQLGYHPTWALGDASIEKSQIEQPLGPALSDSTAGSSSTSQWYQPTANPQVTTFLSAMKKYVPADTTLYQNTATGFATMMTLAAVLKKVGTTITTASVEKFLGTVSGIPVYMGGGATLDAAAAPKQYPHDLNPDYNIVQWQNGNLSFVAKDVNGWTPLG